MNIKMNKIKNEFKKMRMWTKLKNTLKHQSKNVDKAQAQ